MTDPQLLPGSEASSRLAERAARLLEVHAARFSHQLHELESDLVGLNEIGTIQEDRNDTRRLIESVRADLARTQRALQRIDGGRYGRCTSCSEPIAPARLRAIPEAERCSTCA